jgi:Flp pilus assembly protein TadG
MRLQRRQRDRRGVTSLEVAISISLLLTLLLGVMDYGRLTMTKNLMDNAAREGARLAVVSTSATGTSTTLTTSQIQSYVTGFLAGQAVNNLNVQVYQADPTTGANIGAWSTAGLGANIGVQVDLDFKAICPLVIPGTIHLTAKSMMRSEAN